jgi:hypothetical protein
MVNYAINGPIKIDHIVISPTLIWKTRIRPLSDPLYHRICTRYHENHADHSGVAEETDKTATLQAFSLVTSEATWSQCMTA